MTKKHAKYFHGVIMKKKKPDFPNSWEALLDAPDEWFESLPFDFFMERVHNWMLPGSVATMIRTKDLKTKKVKEYIYKTEGRAMNKIKALMVENKTEFIVVDHEYVNHLTPKNNDKQNRTNPNG